MNWIPVSSHPAYEISEAGDVRVTRAGVTKLLKQRLTTMGYPSIMIWDKPKHIKTLVHRLVAQAFIPNPENKPCVNHKDCNRANNAISNLEWVTFAENSAHAKQQGRLPKGEAHPMAKLSDKQVAEIIALGATNTLCLGQIALKYGVTRSTIGNMLRGARTSAGIRRGGVIYSIGPAPTGANAPAAKYSDAKIAEVRQLLAKGHGQLQVAAMAGVGKSLVSLIRRGHRCGAKPASLR